MSDDDEPLDQLTNRQVHVVDAVREYIRDESTKRGQTHSEFLLDVLPDDPDEVTLGYDQGSVVYLKTTPRVDELVSDMTLDRRRCSKGEAIALFVLLHAINQGHYEVADEMTDEVTETLFGLLGVAQ